MSLGVDQLAESCFVVVFVFFKAKWCGLASDELIRQFQLLFVDGLIWDVADVVFGFAQFFGIPEGVGHEAADLLVWVQARWR